jgi:glycosyltransferase involved in cell wall biosynthesis
MTSTSAGENNLSCLWITPKWPLPATDGARVANCSLIRNLTALGVKIDLLSIVEGSEIVHCDTALSELGVRSAQVLRRGGVMGISRARMVSLGLGFLKKPLVALTLQNFSEVHLKAQWDLLLSSMPRGFSAVVYDGLHPAAHALQRGVYHKSPLIGRMIYRAHNRESDIWRRKAEESTHSPLRYFFSYQARLLKRFENSVVKEAYATASVSDEDVARFREDNSAARLRTVPIGFTFTPPPPFREDPDRPHQLLFLGKLDWAPNREGLVWFLERVWPTVTHRREDLALIVVGSGDTSFLDKYRSLPRLKIVGQVDNLAEIYTDSIASLVPIFYGSGTRVKAIEASRYGRPCISTALGVEGVGLTPGESYFHGETPEEWIRLLEQLTFSEAQTYGCRAHDIARRRFDEVLTAQAFLELLC